MAILDFLLKTFGDLSLLSPVLQLTIFRLEVKIKKKDSAGPNFGYSDIECSLRSLALQTLYLIIVQLPRSTHSSYLNQLAAIPGALETLDQALRILMSKTVGEGVSEVLSQEQHWALILLDTAMAYRLAPPAVTTETFQFVGSLAKEETLTAIAFHILILLVDGPCALNFIMQESTVGSIVQIFDSILPKLVVEPAAPPKGKAAKEKKADKDKKSEPQQEKMIDANDPRRPHLLSLRLIIHLLFLISSHSEVTTEEQVTRTVKLTIKIMSSPGIWELVRSPHENTLFVDISDLLFASVLLLGSLGELGEVNRRSACKAGAVTALHELLLQSRNAVGLNAALNEADMILRRGNLSLLRCCIEKSVLLLITERCPTKTETIDWTTCSRYLTDSDILLGSDRVLDLVSIAENVNNDDHDLGNRYLRILACLVHSADDAEKLANNSTPAVAMIAVLLMSRTRTLLEIIKSDLLSNNEAVESKSSQSPSLSEEGRDYTQLNVGDKIEEPDCHRDPDPDAILADALQSRPHKCLLKPIFTRPVQEFDPSVAEVIVLALLLLLSYVEVSSDTVNAIDCESQFKQLGQLLYLCGPSGLRTDAQYLKERKVTPHDMRSPEIEEPLLIRSLVLRLLTRIASAYSKYRTFNGEIPVPCGFSPPDSVSPCQQVVSTLCRECSDACISIILCQCSFTLQGDLIAAKAHPSSPLDLIVLSNSLELWKSIAGCSFIGLHYAVQSSTCAFESQEKVNDFMYSALNSMVEFINSKLIANMKYAPLTFSKLSTDSKEKNSKKSLGRNAMPFFDAYFEVQSALPNCVSSLSDNEELWVYLMHAATMIGVISDLTLDLNMHKLALGSISAMCRIPEFMDQNQPFLADVYSAAFLWYDTWN